MPVYFVRFRPLGPYFFGNEKSAGFWADKDKDPNAAHYAKSYFLPSERRPAQTTILGALRFCCLSRVNANYFVSPEDRARIGDESFNLLKKQQNFGAIRSISPLYLADKENLYIQTPFDHNQSASCERYTPLNDYHTVATAQGERIVPLDYDHKAGMADSCLNLTDLSLQEKLFSSCVRVGVQTGYAAAGAQEDTFYKREYQCLKSGFSFAVFANIDLTLPTRKLVYLGQCKSPFSVTFERTEKWMEKQRRGLAQLEEMQTVMADGKPYRKAIALSDMFVKHDIYESCAFAYTRLREHRTFCTVQSKGGTFHSHIEKTDHFNLLQAGSVFLVKESCWADFDRAHTPENGEQIGLNRVTGMKEETK